MENIRVDNKGLLIRISKFHLVVIVIIINCSKLSPRYWRHALDEVALYSV